MKTDSPNLLTRRSLIQTIGMTAFAGMTQTVLPQSIAQSMARSGATAFALVGDSWHPFNKVRLALDKVLTQEAGITVDYTDDTTRMTAATLQHYKVLILLRANFPMTADQEVAVRDFARNGGGVLFLHNSSHMSWDHPIFRDVMGGSWIVHTPIQPYKVHITDQNHPITRGVQDFIITGEHHYVEYDKPQEHVFMRTVDLEGRSFRNLGTSCEGGWAYDYGAGRVCFLSPGHTVDILWNPEFKKLQQNAVRWLLREI